MVDGCQDPIKYWSAQKVNGGLHANDLEDLDELRAQLLCSDLVFRHRITPQLHLTPYPISTGLTPLLDGEPKVSEASGIICT